MKVLPINRGSTVDEISSWHDALPQALALVPPPPPPLPTGSAASGMEDLRDLLQTAENNGSDAAEAYLYSIDDYNDLLFGGLLAEDLEPAPSAQVSPAELQVILLTHFYLTKLQSKGQARCAFARVTCRESAIGLLPAALLHMHSAKGAFLCNRGRPAAAPICIFDVFLFHRASREKFESPLIPLVASSQLQVRRWRSPT